MIESVKKQLDGYVNTETALEDYKARFIESKFSLRFLRFFFEDYNRDYSSLTDEERKYAGLVAKYGTHASQLNFETTEKMMFYISKSGNMLEVRERAYVALKKFLKLNYLESFYPALMISFSDVLEANDICWPIQEFTLENYEVLSIKVINQLNINKDNYAFFASNFDLLRRCFLDEAVNHAPLVCEKIEEESEKQNDLEEDDDTYKGCDILSKEMMFTRMNVKDEIYQKIINARFIPGYDSEDEPYETCCGSCITFINEKTNEVITYRILNRFSIDKFKETELFTNEDRRLYDDIYSDILPLLSDEEEYKVAVLEVVKFCEKDISL